MEEYNQEDWKVFHKFGIITSYRATYNVEVGAPVSMKAATIVSLRGKIALKT